VKLASSSFRLPLPTVEHSVVYQDNDYDGNKRVETEKTFKQPTASVTTNKKVTEFFTVRRSVRKTKKEVQAERMRNIEQAIREEREEGLDVSCVALCTNCAQKVTKFLLLGPHIPE